MDLSRPAARHLAMAGLVLASGLGAILLYLPMLDQMWGHEHLGGVGRFNGDILRMMPVILGYFTSVRWLLIGVIVAGAFGWALRLRSPGDRAAAWRLPFLAFVLLMPFVLSFVKGDRAVDRLFLNQAVIFALLVAVAAHHARALVARPRAWGAVLAALLAIYCYGCFGVAFWRIDARLQRAAAGDGDRHDIYYGWYASHFHPSRLTAQLRDLPRDPSVPVAVHACADGVAMAACLVRDQILFRWMPDLAGLEFDAEGRAYIITGAPARTRAELARLRPDVECRAIETDPGCHSLLLCRRRAAVPVER